MTSEERLTSLLRSAFPPMSARMPTKDLWPAITAPTRERDSWLWIDIGIAAVAAGVLLLFPRLLWLLAYHF